jgi:hypothetical protein
MERLHLLMDRVKPADLTPQEILALVAVFESADQRVNARTAPVGWYPNPLGAPGLLYRDGHMWHTPLVPSTPPVPLPPPKNTAVLVVCLVAAIGGAIGALALAILIAINAGSEKEAPPLPAARG